jgi:MerR family transcriptional regulator, Zn(II)-responsive regulator of zntA
MYTIGQLAKRAHINTDSVRFYERQGLVSPGRKTSSGYRLYSDDALRRITFIKHAQRCGFSLAEIRDLLRMRDGVPTPPNEVYRFVHEKRAEIEITIAALQSMSKWLAEFAGEHPLNGSSSAQGAVWSAQDEHRQPHVNV